MFGCCPKRTLRWHKSSYIVESCYLAVGLLIKRRFSRFSVPPVLRKRVLFNTTAVCMMPFSLMPVCVMPFCLMAVWAMAVGGLAVRTVRNEDCTVKTELRCPPSKVPSKIGLRDLLHD